ncbi:hypothetical protein [Mycobacterium sp. C31M]
MAQSAVHRGRALDEFIATVGELASEDASRGWLAAMYGLADRAWDAHPDAVTSIGSHGAARIADGLLSGRWTKVVGAAKADWLLLHCVDGYLPIPAGVAQIDVHDRPSALVDAGIADIAVIDARVGADRIAIDGAVMAAVSSSAVVGTALGGWRRHVDQVRARLAISYGGDEITDEAAAQIARTASDLDAARLQIATSGLADAAPYAQAITRARRAMDRLLASSRHALDASDPVTAAWRDVHAGCRLAAALVP